MSEFTFLMEKVKTWAFHVRGFVEKMVQLGPFVQTLNINLYVTLYKIWHDLLVLEVCAWYDCQLLPQETLAHLM